ncbi:hypothetical protein E2C01_100546 [Portunus trituberculatus]|uniref:Uncharacterized protein n=1 Tax=Portunus trituberculatus TaxID=210409 RepID=A0A5B7KJR0_PORTR|nr:hypothetical protein [Portunus trituberculatus]
MKRGHCKVAGCARQVSIEEGNEKSSLRFLAFVPQHSTAQHNTKTRRAKVTPERLPGLKVLETARSELQVKMITTLPTRQTLLRSGPIISVTFGNRNSGRGNRF